MTAIATMRRRRRQQKNNYKHLAKLGRPVRKKASPAKAARRLARALEKQKLIAIRKGMSVKAKS